MVSGETVNVSTGQKAVSNAIGDLVQAPASPSEYPPDPEVEELFEPDKDSYKEDIEQQPSDQNYNSTDENLESTDTKGSEPEEEEVEENIEKEEIEESQEI